MLIWGGILGLLLYFSETIVQLIKYAYVNISRVNVVGEDVFKKYRYVKNSDVASNELEMLEKILLYSDENSKDFKRIIDLILHYKEKIYSEDMELLKLTDCPLDVTFEIESLVDTIVSVFIVTLVSVENRDPLPGEKKFFNYILDIPKLLQHLGYIFLNTLSFNLLTSYFVHEAFYLLGINLIMGFLASSFLFVVQRILRNRLRNCIRDNSVY